MHDGITGHRGDADHVPENTTASFAAALALGVDWVELDVRQTSDGRLVVIHDADTQRVGDRRLEVAASTWAELRLVDVACGFRRARGLPLASVALQRIPLLEEVLALIAAHPGQRVSIQPKTDCVAEVLALVDRLGIRHAVGFNDDDLGKMQAVKRHDRRIPVFWDRCGGRLADDIEIARVNGFACIVQHADHLDPAGIAALHGAGLQAGAWTVNQDEDMRRFLAAGIDRIYTDRPAALIAVRREMGLV